MQPYEVVISTFIKHKVNYKKVDYPSAVVLYYQHTNTSRKVITTTGLMFYKDNNRCDILLTDFLNTGKNRQKYLKTLEACNYYTRAYDNLKAFIDDDGRVKIQSTYYYNIFDANDLLLEIDSFLNAIERDIYNRFSLRK